MGFPGTFCGGRAFGMEGASGIPLRWDGLLLSETPGVSIAGSCPRVSPFVNRERALRDSNPRPPHRLLGLLTSVEGGPEDLGLSALGLALRVAREGVRKPEHAETLLAGLEHVAAADDQPLLVRRVRRREIEHRLGETLDRLARAALENLITYLDPPSRRVPRAC